MTKAEQKAKEVYPQKGDNLISQEGYDLMRSIYADGYEAGYDEALKEQKPIVMNTPRYSPPEQKPEWSEEDEKMRNRIIDILNRTFSVYSAIGTTTTRPSVPTYNDEIAWLKSLKNRGNFPKSNTNSPCWKPSEEQMQVLEKLIKFARGGCLFYTRDLPIADSLYNDLKKLEED